MMWWWDGSWMIWPFIMVVGCIVVDGDDDAGSRRDANAVRAQR